MSRSRLILLGIRRERRVVRAARAGGVALRGEGVAAYVVEVRRERAGRRDGSSSASASSCLRLLDKHAREPRARNLARSSASREPSMTARRRFAASS